MSSSFTTSANPAESLQGWQKTRRARSGKRSAICPAISAQVVPWRGIEAGPERAGSPPLETKAASRFGRVRVTSVKITSVKVHLLSGEIAAMPGKPESQVQAPEPGGLVETVARPAHLGERVAAPPADDPVGPRRPGAPAVAVDRVHHRGAAVEIDVVVVLAPFPHVAVQVVQPECVGLARAHLLDLAPGALAVPGVPRQRALVWAAPLPPGGGAAGELPFGLGGQAAAHPQGEQLCLEPAHAGGRLPPVAARAVAPEGVEQGVELVRDRVPAELEGAHLDLVARALAEEGRPARAARAYGETAPLDAGHRGRDVLVVPRLAVAQEAGGQQLLDGARVPGAQQAVDGPAQKAGVTAPGQPVGVERQDLAGPGEEVAAALALFGLGGRDRRALGPWQLPDSVGRDPEGPGLRHL